MGKEQYCSVIWSLFLSGKISEEIKFILVAVNGTHLPSCTTIYHSFAEFRRGQTSVSDKPRPGGPKTVTTQETMDKIDDLVFEDGWVKNYELGKIAGLSTKHVSDILHEILGTKKMFARWVPRLLTKGTKRIRKIISKMCLVCLIEIQRTFCVVSWPSIHWYTSETKKQSKQWVLLGKRAPKQSKTRSWAKMEMVTLFRMH